MKKLVRPNVDKGTRDIPPRLLKRREKEEKPKEEKESFFKRGFYLRSALDIRRMLSRLINQTVNGEIEESLLRVVSYSSTVFLKSLEIGELTDQLKEIAKDVEKLKEQVKGKQC
ncbi:MAG: hypothetical protein ABIN18_14420 [Pseudomonadota bacterium]